MKMKVRVIANAKLEIALGGIEQNELKWESGKQSEYSFILENMIHL